VMLLREAKIPARYATGYVVDESERKGKTYLVRERDAHAWALVYRADKNLWEEFDPTPASSGRAENFKASNWESISDFFSNLKFQYSKWRWSETTYTSYLKWLLIPLVLFLVWRILSNKRRRGNASQAQSSQPIWPGMDSEFYLIEEQMRDAGFGRQPSEPLAHWQQRLSSAVPHPEDLVEILTVHRRLRFDPQGVPIEDRQNFRDDVAKWLNTFDSQRVNDSPHPSSKGILIK
ncbi:MAG: DUF4129 domain-containing transglutaminase family protein, partial [Verrucomicrobiota bacterium]